MRAIKFILLGLAGLIVLLCLIGLALPATYKVERSIEIAAPMINIYPKVHDPKGWAQWGVWGRRDPGMKVSYSGAPAGVGANWSWQSKSEGNGGMEIVKADFDKTVAYVLSIEGIDNPFNGRIDFAPAGDKVKVTWTGEGNVGMSPIGRWFAFFMDKMLGPDLEASLKNLKELAERKG
jgi:hypothetical protein